MISTHDTWQPKNTAALRPYLDNTRAAGLHLDDLYAEADAARLAKAYRRAHPELGMRCRLAATLRRLADRLAPTAPTRTPITRSAPSPSAL